MRRPPLKPAFACSWSRTAGATPSKASGATPDAVGQCAKLAPDHGHFMADGTDRRGSFRARHAKISRQDETSSAARFDGDGAPRLAPAGIWQARGGEAWLRVNTEPPVAGLCRADPRLPAGGLGPPPHANDAPISPRIVPRQRANSMLPDPAAPGMADRPMARSMRRLAARPCRPTRLLGRLSARSDHGRPRTLQRQGRRRSVSRFGRAGRMFSGLAPALPSPCASGCAPGAPASLFKRSAVA
jgi:hypothetical protein